MWQNESIFYQIYPFGFCGAPSENDGKTVGRISRVLEWMDYFTDLGIDAVLFNPIFQSDRHGYDIRDYAQVDCRLGTNEDFMGICKALHKHGIRVILDGVFNHVGRGFWAFQDVLEYREKSAYKDWFHIRFDQDNGYHDGLFYEGWEGHYELVKLNLANQDVIDHLLSCVRSWIEEFGIDGLRLDVAYCVDKNFLKLLRSYCEKIKPDFFLMGEILFGDYKQIVNDSMLHSCTNYECYKGIYSSLNDRNLFEISYSLNRQFGSEAGAIYKGLHLFSFVDNHDVSRIASILTNKQHLPLAFGLLFGMPGIPCIYYGSECGTLGDKQAGDDALRPYLDLPGKNDLTDYIAKLILIRKNNKALCYGGYQNIVVTNRQLVFERSIEGERIWIVINADDLSYTLTLDTEHHVAVDLLTDTQVQIKGHCTIPPYSIAFWKI